jgi:hypothetical protein
MSIKNDSGKSEPILVVHSEICENLPLSLTISTDKPDLFKTIPNLSQTGYLTFETKETRAGIANIEMTLSDSFGQCTDKKSFDLEIIATGAVLSIEKQGRGQIQIDDGNPNTCLPCYDDTECTKPCMVLPSELSPDDHLFPKNSTVTLTAVPYTSNEERWFFKNWQKAANETTKTIILELTEDLTSIKAVFEDVYTPVAYAVVIQGRNIDREGERFHRFTTDYVYGILKKRGLMEDDIIYLKYDDENTPIKDPENEPTLEKIQNAITIDSLNKMKNNKADLYIVVVGHGNNESIFFDEKVLSSSKLNQWLEVYDHIDHDNIIVIIGTCKSGSFIKNLSGAKRIIITSSGADENSNKGKYFGNNLTLEGDYFIYHFFNNVYYGDSIRDSFREASLATSNYFDNQEPLLEDNNDKEGTFNLLSELNGEGEKSKNVYIGKDISPQETDHLITRFSVLPYTLLENDHSTASFTLDLHDCKRFDQFWIDIRRDLSNAHKDSKRTKPKMLIDPNTFSSSKAEWYNIDRFEESGTYQVLFFGKEASSDHVLLLRKQTVYKKIQKNDPPDRFAFVKTNNNVIPIYCNPEYYFLLDWTDAIDRNKHTFTYTLKMSNNDNNTIFNEIPASFSIIKLNSINYLGQTYHYELNAIDQYGAESFFLKKQMYVSNPNNQQGWIKGAIFDNLSKKPVCHASVFQVSNQSSTLLNISMDGKGKFIGYAPLGMYKIKVEADGYFYKTLTVSISQLWPDNEIILFLELDLSLDILVLKYLANIINKEELLSNYDIIDMFDDGKIGLHEAIHILNRFHRRGD